MSDLRYTLVSDGSSDRALIPIISWVLKTRLVNRAIQPEWADLRRLPNPPSGLQEKIARTLELYPCDVLFVHRDAETEPRQSRATEIRQAIERMQPAVTVPAVCVVPVRMTEAWLLIDEVSLRRAAGNPNGSAPLDWPELASLEQLPNPKQVLYRLLRDASGLPARRKTRLPIAKLVHRLAELIKDYAPLRQLPAFRALGNEIDALIQADEL